MRKHTSDSEKKDMEFLRDQQIEGKPTGGRRGSMLKEKPRDMKGTVSKLVKYIGRSKYLVIGLFIATVLTVVLGLAGPVLQGETINAINEELTPEQLAEFPDIKVGDIIDGDPVVLVKNTEDGLKAYTFNEDRMLNMVILLSLTYLLSSAISYFSSIFSAKLSQTTVYTMRRDLFGNMSYLPIRFIDTHKHGDLMSRMTNDVDNISNSISMSISSLFSGVLTLAGTFAVMFYYSWQMTLVSLIIIPMTVVVSTFLSKVMRRYFVRQQRVLGSLNSQVEEMVTGYTTVMAYGHEDESEKEFDDLSVDLKKTGIKATIFGSVMGPLMNMIGNIGFLAVAVAGGLFASSNVIKIGTILTFIQYSRNLSRPINEIANQYTNFVTAIAGAERVFEVMDSPKENDEIKPDICVDEVKGDIDFDEIEFAYKEGEPVLKKFDLHVKRGQTIAIVGRTGSGKTTVVNLLTRFYDLDSGRIRLDGRDITEFSKKSLRDSIGIVLQDTVLFTDTVANNIRYGNQSATDEEVRAAAHTANADVFIERLPEGYDTVLTGSGANLSQGQRQLIAIARAVLADPKILILDEATSSVDTRTEMQIQQAMIKLMENRTSLVIAHRLSTIRDADKIIVISDGHIVESGNHYELLGQKGVYYDLYMTQFSGLET